MRRLFRRLWRLLTAPFRLLAWPFRALRDFVNMEPEDSTASDAFARTLENPAVLVSHLEDLRRHLFRGIAALMVTTAMSFAFARQILDWMARPAGGIQALQAIEVTESVGAFMKVSLLSGIVLAFPYLLFEAFAFINPGLKRRERILILTIIPFAFLLFLLGIAFTYYVLLPVALPFLIGFGGITTIPRPASVLGFVTSVMLWIGIAFQFPLVIYALAAVGLVKSRTLLDGWRIAIVGMAIVSAVVTPTVDPVNMLLVMGPMIALYFISIGMAALAQRGRERRLAREMIG